MDAVRLADLEAIKLVKARYFYALDTKQWDMLRSLFTTDATFDPAREGSYTFEGLDDFIELASKGLATAVSVHHGHMPIIAFVNDAEATGIWAMTDDVEQRNSRRFIGQGHYHERYRKVGNDWKIASWKLTRLRVDTVSEAQNSGDDED